MKNKIYPSVLLFLLFLSSGFVLVNPQNNELVGFALNIDSMEKHYQKDNYGEYLPIYLVSNGLIEEKSELKFKSYPIQVITKASDLPKGDERTVIELHGMKIKKKKASLVFTSGGKNIKITLKKKDGHWIYSRLVSKSASSLEMDF